MNKSYRKGFTLVELLAVIVVLAIILVIAVPKIMSVITDSKKVSLETNAKIIASAAEKLKLENKLNGNANAAIECNDVAELSYSDYKDCKIKFDKDNNAIVSINGKGKFEGISVCKANKNKAIAQEEEYLFPVNFKDDSWLTIIDAVQSGDYPYKVGDTKEVALNGFTNSQKDTNGLYTIRIVNTTPCNEAFPSGTEGKSETACGFVLEFADIITMYNMNSTDTNAGGWPASNMYSYLNKTEKEGSGTIYNALPEELKNAIIDTKVISSVGSEDKALGISSFTTYGVKLYLLSVEEVAKDLEDTPYEKYDSSVGTSRQLDYYSDLEVSTSDFSSAIKNNGAILWWLRSAHSDSAGHIFGFCITDLPFCGYSADNTNQVAPAFRLAE